MATIDGTTGDDTLIGTANRDTIYGNGGSDLIYGAAADDYIFGARPFDMTEMAASTIDAGDGNDTVVLDNGNDVLIGGSGSDTLHFRSGGPGDLILDLSITTAQNTGYGNKTISGFENLLVWEDISVNFTGNAADNRILTRGGIDTIYGLGGNDVISVQNGDDYVNGGAGDDLITVEGANNTVYGGAGNNFVSLHEGTGNNLIDLGAGDGDLLSLNDQVGTFDVRNQVTGQNDTIRGVEQISINNYGVTQGLTFFGSDSINSYSFQDVATLNATLSDGDDYISIRDSDGQVETGLGNDTIRGTSLQEMVLSAGGGADSIAISWLDAAATINGGDGDDFIKTHWAEKAIVLSGGAGNDTIDAIWSYVAGSDGFAATLSGGAGNDYVSGGYSLNRDDDHAGYRLEGGNGDDTLRGYDYDDFLIGGAGADSMYGDEGDDIYVVDHAGDIVAEGRDDGHDLVRSTVSFTLGTYVEDLTLRGPRAIDGTGNALANILRGNNAANELRGEDGNDLLIGQAGNDTLAGGAGVDTLIGGAGNDTYIADSFDSVRELANAGWDQLHSWSSTWLGNNIEALVLRGNADASGFGNALDNRIEGNAGDNFLSGGAGSDTMLGGAGNDTYTVDAGDLVQESANAGIDTVRSDLTWSLGAHFENLTLLGNAAINGTGNALANTIRGNDAANSLNGLDGNDLLIGGDGDDTLNGWAGIDTLKGGAGNDTYITNGNEVIEDIGGIDLVRSGGDFWLGADLEHLTLMGTAIAGDGNYRANRLIGNTADNVLDGRGGNDTLIGGAGNDTLMGGLGTDRFVFHSGHDVVADFETGTDILRIDDAVWGGTPRSAADLVAAAQVTGSGVLFHFGADDSILLEGLTSKAGLEDDLTIF